MAKLRDMVARAIYSLRPATQPWDGASYSFDEAGAKWDREKAKKQADAALAAITVDHVIVPREYVEWMMDCKRHVEDSGYVFYAPLHRNMELIAQAAGVDHG